MKKLIELLKDVIGKVTEIRFKAKLYGVWGHTLHFYTEVPSELEQLMDKEVEVIIRRKL